MIDTPADLIKVIDERISHALAGARQSRKSTIDSAYSSGDPKTKRPGETSAAAITKKIIAPYALPTIVQPGDTVVESPLGQSTIVHGVLTSPFDYTGGYFLIPTPTSNDLTTLGFASVDQVRAYRFFLDRPLKVSRIVAETVAGNTNAHFSVGIYSNDRAMRLATTGAQIAQPPSFISIAITAVVLGSGFYWVAVCADDTTIELRAVVMDANMRTSLNNTVVHLGNSATGGSGGAVPTSLGTISSDTIGIPLIKLQA